MSSHFGHLRKEIATSRHQETPAQAARQSAKKSPRLSFGRAWTEKLIHGLRRLKLASISYQETIPVISRLVVLSSLLTTGQLGIGANRRPRMLANACRVRTVE
jgi:hypothetical protein